MGSIKNRQCATWNVKANFDYQFIPFNDAEN